MKGKCLIGTSGFSYDHWDGVFYPRGMPAKERLKFYARSFATVEINNTFYHLPKEETFRGWASSVPAGFIFAIKASRFITHIKRLKDVEPVGNLLNRLRPLGKGLGPILFQLPPNWNCDPARLSAFLERLPEGFKYSLEFRDRSRFNKEVYSLMEKRGVAFCIHDLLGLDCPFVVTAPLVYIRFHGTVGKYMGRYSKEDLRRWAERIEGLLKREHQVYTYFNNDAFGYAVENALELRDILGEPFEKGYPQTPS